MNLLSCALNCVHPVRAYHAQLRSHLGIVGIGRIVAGTGRNLTRQHRGPWRWLVKFQPAPPLTSAASRGADEWKFSRILIGPRLNSNWIAVGIQPILAANAAAIIWSDSDRNLARIRLRFDRRPVSGYLMDSPVHWTIVICRRWARVKGTVAVRRRLR